MKHLDHEYGVNDFLEMFKDADIKQKLQYQFDTVLKSITNTADHTSRLTVGVKHPHLNREADYLPCNVHSINHIDDDTRVVLEPSKHNSNTYINANYIDVRLLL